MCARRSGLKYEAARRPMLYSSPMSLTRFVFIVTGRNVQEFLPICLDSIELQDYNKFYYRTVVFDDCSTDKSAEILQRRAGPGLTAVCNTRRRYMLYNHVRGMKDFCQPDEVAVLLDSDDFLHDPTVLSTLNEAYSSGDMWATYGNYIHLSNSKIRQNHKVEGRFDRRNRKQQFSHLKTAKAWLADCIHESDFLDKNGDYYKYAPDFCLFFPIAEMCGEERLAYVDKPLVVYNDLNPAGESKLYLKEQTAVANEIRQKSAYKAL